MTPNKELINKISNQLYNKYKHLNQKIRYILLLEIRVTWPNDTALGRYCSTLRHPETHSIYGPEYFVKKDRESIIKSYFEELPKDAFESKTNTYAIHSSFLEPKTSSFTDFNPHS